MTLLVRKQQELLAGHRRQQRILDGIGSPPGVGGAAMAPPGLSPSQGAVNLAPVVLSPDVGRLTAAPGADDCRGRGAVLARLRLLQGPERPLNSDSVGATMDAPDASGRLPGAAPTLKGLLAFTARHQAPNLWPSLSTPFDSRVAAGLLATLDTVPGAESTLTTSELEFAERVVHAPGLLESNAGRDLLGSHVGSRAVRLVVFEDAAQAFFLLAAILPAQSSIGAALGRLIDAAPPGYRCEAVLLFFTKRDSCSTAEALARAGLRGLQ